jgi:hypothetical protein
MCGDVGQGAMEEPAKIAQQVKRLLQKGNITKTNGFNFNNAVMCGAAIALVGAMAAFKS